MKIRDCPSECGTVDTYAVFILFTDLITNSNRLQIQTVTRGVDFSNANLKCKSDVRAFVDVHLFRINIGAVLIYGLAYIYDGPLSCIDRWI